MKDTKLLDYTPSELTHTDDTPSISIIATLGGSYPYGNPLDTRSGLDKVRESSLITDTMKRREALRIKAVNAASKVGNGYRNFATPVQPEWLHSPMTNGFGI